MAAFDSFAWPAGQLGFRASNGPFTPADLKGQTGNVPSPLFFVDRQTNATLVVSPMDHFHGWACTAVDNMGPGSESSPGPSGWGCGIMNTVPELPAGFESGTVLFGGVGVTDTMAKWGSAMQAWYNTTREKDLQTTKLGVYTDNGICTVPQILIRCGQLLRSTCWAGTVLRANKARQHAQLCVTYSSARPTCRRGLQQSKQPEREHRARGLRRDV